MTIWKVQKEEQQNLKPTRRPLGTGMFSAPTEPSLFFSYLTILVTSH